MNRYYLFERPPSIGTFPKPQGNKVLAIRCFPYGKKWIDEIDYLSWGWVEYEKPISKVLVEDYELMEVPNDKPEEI